MTTLGDRLRLELLSECLDDGEWVARNEQMLRDLLNEIDAELAWRDAEGSQ